MTGWVYNDAFLRHNATLAHPECPGRLRAIFDRLESDGLLTTLHRVESGHATGEDLRRVHSRSYLDLLNRVAGTYLDPDTFIGEDSFEIARLAAGGVATAARLVRKGVLANAFCAIRPPGHHALRDRAMGFCLINNVAVAACAVLADHPGDRVFILDWDVHHGNGTQAVFYDSAEVLYASLHQFPFYPGSGAAGETGRGAGLGFTVNKPLPAGAGDREFLSAIEAIICDHAASFSPDVILISAGFDAHRDDPLGGLDVSTGGFLEATKRVCDFADEVCEGRVVSVLEGGYNLAALADCVLEHVKELRTRAQRRKGIGKSHE